MSQLPTLMLLSTALSAVMAICAFTTISMAGRIDMTRYTIIPMTKES